ncbi:hypothetical protein CMI37_07835 [Candidatus Pacearchaeota archaeon]|nr:hypothetical protein [Candidatus Pacearchaeota archaeon]|tara:strand:+ start:838 stop:1218 length:381 start_codon:yes stop_codon:yes gene_type:complete
MNFTVKSVEDGKELGRLKEFMLTQPQFYPDYRDWVDGVCIPGISAGNRQAIIVMSNGAVVGDAVYRGVEGGTEIKNFRIDSDYRNRDLGHFLLRQVERESKGVWSFLMLVLLIFLLLNSGQEMGFI